MSDLISRQAAIEAILNLHDCYNGFSDTYDKACIVGVLEEVPSADVVEVVRCKDCKHYVPDDYNCMQMDTGGKIYRPDGYCSFAERRTDGEIH